MTSKVEICNLSLLGIGQPGINTLDQDNKAARLLKKAYDPLRRATLRAHPWNFAETVASLTALTTAPAWGYAYQLPVPADFLRMNGTDRGRIDFKIRRGPPGIGRVIMCDFAPLNILYGADVDVEAEFDAMFVVAFARGLAEWVCPALTGSDTLTDAQRQFFADQQRAARGVDAQENGQDTIVEESSWNDARFR